jgi:hypothetical protein
MSKDNSFMNKGLVGLAVIVLGFIGFVAVVDDPNSVSELVDDVKDRAGSAIYTNVDQYANGVGIGDEVVVWEKVSLEAGDNNLGWENKTGKTVYVDLATVTTSGTASTTFTIDVATSSTENISDFTSPFSEIIDSYQLSTSSVAQTINSEEDQGTNGMSVVPVADGEFVSLLLSAGEPAQTGEPSCDGSVCETATSTNRGFNLDLRFRYHYDK